MRFGNGLMGVVVGVIYYLVVRADLDDVEAIQVCKGGKAGIQQSMSKMRAVQVPRPEGPLELVERDIPEPGVGSVRIRVEACGICHSDSLMKDGLWPGLQYPRVPGHEVAGIIDAVGPGVAGWNAGQRVGVGWHGGHCGSCDSCRRGDFVTCQIAPQIPGFTYDGGYAEYMIAPTAALALIPDELSAADAGPLMCAGITTYNLSPHADRSSAGPPVRRSIRRTRSPSARSPAYGR